MLFRTGLLSIAAVVAGAFHLLFSTGAALADKRVALVIGNSSYQNGVMLSKPARDAGAIAETLERAGFDTVILRLDLVNIEFKRALRRFEDDASDADIALVYYAGHGIEIGGTNFMLPVDVTLASDRDADDEAIPLERILESIERARKLRLIILDACRENPFVTSMERQRQSSVRAPPSRGLSKVEPKQNDTLIVYAAKAGATAEDGSGEHSPLATALLNNLTLPGLDLRIALGKVRDEVIKISGGRQESWYAGTLRGANTSLVSPPTSTQQPPTQLIEPMSSDAKADYERVAQIGTRKALEAFLDTYKTGFYADLGREQLARLIANEQAATRAEREAKQRADEAKAAVPEAERRKTESPRREPWRSPLLGARERDDIKDSPRWPRRDFRPPPQIPQDPGPALCKIYPSRC
jgi:uncharacterized caspase-like protein